MYSPKIDEKLIPKLYKLGKRLRKPMTVVVNGILQDALDDSSDRFRESGITFTPTTHKKTSGKTTKVRFSLLIKCPFCERKYKSDEGEFLEIILKNGRRKKLHVCMNCYQKV